MTRSQVYSREMEQSLSEAAERNEEGWGWERHTEREQGVTASPPLSSGDPGSPLSRVELLVASFSWMTW